MVRDTVLFAFTIRSRN